MTIIVINGLLLNGETNIVLFLREETCPYYPSFFLYGGGDGGVTINPVLQNF